jgi:P-type conjugative transfer protein TrbJ
MRKGLIAGLLIVVFVQPPQPAEAGAFATEVTQILNHGQLIMQYLRQGEQLANEIKMLEDMLRNVKPLPGQTFGPICCGY